MAWAEPSPWLWPTRARTWPWACAWARTPRTWPRRSRAWAGGRYACRWTCSTSSRSERPCRRCTRPSAAIDILVNNAGIGPEEAAAEDWTEADFDATFDLNVKGSFFASQAVARLMIEQGGGRIVNMSSQAGFIALPGEAIYCASKAAVSHLTKCHAVEWGQYGINVNAVAPTFIRTPGTAPALADAAFKADVEERIAGLHRIGEPVDVAGAVVYLASPAASLVTGTTLMVDGGWTAR